jgi:hypothetical protein
MTRTAKRLNRIDLFDLTPLAPFTRQGLTNALLMMIETGFKQMMWIVGGLTLVTTAVALLSVCANPTYSIVDFDRDVCAISYQPHYWLSHNRFMQVIGCSPGLISDTSKGRTQPETVVQGIYIDRA